MKKEDLKMSYSKCVCQKCGSNYATVAKTDHDIQNEPCPKCGEKQLKLSGALNMNEMSSLFSGGG
jgi:Zn finger protein HypA/HybF involved in hydrogenase expression